MKKLVNFTCDEALLKAFDAKLPEHMTRTEALIILMEAVTHAELKLYKQVTTRRGIEVEK